MQYLSNSHSNRGMDAQNFVSDVVNIYNSKGWAAIQEIAVPIVHSRKGFAYGRKSTVDFVGLAYNKHVDFDVKSTRERTRFPLANIEQHQYNWLEMSRNQGSNSFILINFVKLNEWYVLTFSILKEYWERWKTGGKASIPIADLRMDAISVREGGKTGLDFLEFLKANKER